jgi:hypothetical protein
MNVRALYKRGLKYCRLIEEFITYSWSGTETLMVGLLMTGSCESDNKILPPIKAVELTVIKPLKPSGYYMYHMI